MGLSLRWFVRRLLRWLPRRAPAPPGPDGPREVLYLFAGTYGDMVQCLRALEEIRSQYPAASLRLFAPVPIFQAFAPFFPAGIRRIGGAGICLRALHRADLLLTNVIGGYRVRFDLAAYLCARRSLGFCYGDEKGRTAWTFCLRLSGWFHTFEELDLELARRAASPVLPRRFDNPLSGRGPAVPPTGRWKNAVVRPGEVLFHLGSAGLKNDMGLPAYAALVLRVMDLLRRQGRTFQLVAGPQDVDIVHALGASLAGATVLVRSLPELKEMVLGWRGPVLCFNSFFAHFCHHLGVAAVVLHRNAVPNGYDCAPLHIQILLREQDGWGLQDLEELF